MDREEILYALNQIHEVEISDTTEDFCLVYDNRTGKAFQFEFNVDEKRLASKIQVSPSIPKNLQINAHKFAKYLLSHVDANAFSTLDSLWFVASKQDYDKLAKTFSCCEPYEFRRQREIGVMWFDNNVCIVDVRNIVDRVKKTETLYLNEKIQKEIVVTAIHELRHLMLDCNIALSRSEYPNELAKEFNVEEYAQDVVEKDNAWKMVFGS